MFLYIQSKEQKKQNKYNFQLSMSYSSSLFLCCLVRERSIPAFKLQRIIACGSCFLANILAATSPAANAAPNAVCNLTQQYLAMKIFVLSFANPIQNQNIPSNQGSLVLVHKPYYDFLMKNKQLLVLTLWYLPTKLTAKFATGNVRAHRICHEAEDLKARGERNDNLYRLECQFRNIKQKVMIVIDGLLQMRREEFG